MEDGKWKMEDGRWKIKIVQYRSKWFNDGSI